MSKKKISLFLVLALVFVLASCNANNNMSNFPGGDKPGLPGGELPGGNTNLGDNDQTFGDDLGNSGIYDGMFEEEQGEYEIKCVSGTPNCYEIKDNVITFKQIANDSVYYISGKFKGNIVIDVGDEYKFDLEFRGFSIIAEKTNPILVLSGNEVTITAKKDYENYIYDEREAIDETDEALYSSAIHSQVDLEIAGKGCLNVVSKNNNGIHSKDDLQVKNLTLLVTCKDNALKGNDSVEISNANLTLIASAGDGIKTTNSDISDKGNQRGIVSITGGTCNIYAACDGIDASYDVIIDEETTVLNIYTDKYSNYSEQVTTTNQNNMYIRFISGNYKFSVKYYNSDVDYVFVDAEYDSSFASGYSTYYFYTFPKKSEYAKVKFYMYDQDMASSQEDDYMVTTDYLTINDSYDTFALNFRAGAYTYNWTTYEASKQATAPGGRPGGGPGGPGGGMQEGNQDKGEYSTKGIKAANSIVINNGQISIKAYDDALHANIDTTLENGSNPTGMITIKGGNLTLYSNDDALHADGNLNITGGNISISHSYEGLEGSTVNISGGDIAVISNDDGINAVATSGIVINITGGKLYVYCKGDGLDSNSRTSNTGIVFDGGKVVVISASNGNSAIDSERGYQYKSGYVLALTSAGGMNESTNCANFTSIAIKTNLSLSANNYLTITDSGQGIVTIKMPINLSAQVVYLNSNKAVANIATSSSESFDKNGVAWTID